MKIDLKSIVSVLSQQGRVPALLSCNHAARIKVHWPIPPFVAIPTAAGAKSETTVAAVIPGSKAHKHLAGLADVCGIDGANEEEKANAFLR